MINISISSSVLARPVILALHLFKAPMAHKPNLTKAMVPLLFLGLMVQDPMLLTVPLLIHGMQALEDTDKAMLADNTINSSIKIRITRDIKEGMRMRVSLNSVITLRRTCPQQTRSARDKPTPTSLPLPILLLHHPLPP